MAPRASGKAAGPATVTGTVLNMEADFSIFRGKILELPYISSIRPSTLLGYLVCCAPPQLPSPFEATGITLQDYLDALTIVPNSVTSRKNGSQLGQPQSGTASAPTVRGLYSNDWRSIPGEVQSWQSIQNCLDIFVQRLSVADASSKQQMRTWYEGLLEIGGHFHGAI